MDFPTSVKPYIHFSSRSNLFRSTESQIHQIRDVNIIANIRPAISNDIAKVVRLNGIKLEQRLEFVRSDLSGSLILLV